MMPATTPATTPTQLALHRSSVERRSRFYKTQRQFVRQAVAPITNQPSVKQIMVVVANKYIVSVSEIISSRRTTIISEARSVAMYLARCSLSQSFPKLANKFGSKHHTTVLYACRRVSQKIRNNSRFAAEIASMQAAIGEARQ